MKTKININAWKKRVISLFPILLIGLTVLLPYLAPTSVKAATTYIFTTFKGDAAADQKLWVYTSTDALNFNLLSNTGYGGPTGVVRDPSIIKHTDGKYYIAHTVQSWTTQSTYFAIASSTNLINWTHLTTVNAGVSGTAYTWAPEWFIDGSTVKIIVSLGNASHSFKPYIYTAQNSALTSWSGAADMGIGTNHIDTYVVKSGSTYHAFVKDETSKYIEHATASSLTGPWTWAGTGNWAGWGSGLEGPAVVQMDSGTWRIYLDLYPGGSLRTATSSNLNSWSGLSTIGVSPSGIVRHGTVLRDASITPAAYYKIRSRASGKYLDNMGSTSDGANVCQWVSSSSYNQQWIRQDLGGGYFKFACRTGGKYLDGMGRTTDGSNVAQYTNSSSYNQQWQVVDAGGGYVKIMNRATGKYLDTAGATADGSVVKQYSSSTNYNQQWQIVAP